MSDFLSSLRSDLLDRRRLPILIVLGVALVAAVAFAVLSGGSNTSPSVVAASPASPVSSVHGIAVVEAKPNANQPVAETTSGSSKQRGGPTRDPFAPLPGSAAKSPATSASSSAGAATSTSSPSSSSGSGASSESGSSSGSAPAESGSGSSGSGGSAPTPIKKSPSPKKEASVYHVDVVFGTAPAGTPAASAQLTPFESLTRQQPLPSSAQPLVVFRGVTTGGKSATFTLVGEAILRGSAVCLPSASQCQAIALKPGQTEELEYIPLGGTAVTYQLRVVSIKTVKATAAIARREFRGESKSGLKLLRSAGLTALPGLRYSRSKGVLVLAGHRAFAARVRAGGWGVPPGLRVPSK
jgi:hypothetical protein